MKKVKTFVLSLLAGLLAITWVSCDNGLSKIEKYAYKLIDDGTYYELGNPFDNSGYTEYYAYIPLDTLIGNVPILGNTVDVNLRFASDIPLKSFGGAVIKNSWSETSNWFEKIDVMDKFAFSVDEHLTISNNNNSLDYSSNCSLYLYALIDKNELPSIPPSSIKIYYDSVEASYSISKLVPQRKEFQNGIVVVETDETGKGLKITLNGTADNFWDVNRYSPISITNGLSIDLGDYTRPAGVGDQVVIYYPFTAATPEIYEISFLRERDRIISFGGIGEVNLSQINNISLGYELPKYPMASIRGIDNSVIEASVASITDENVTPNCEIIL